VKFKRWTLLACFLALLPGSIFAASLRFIPLAVMLDSEPRRGTLTIVNAGDEKVTVQLQLMKWSQGADGADVYEPTKDLVFYPQIFSISAGKQGIVRVGYETVGAFSVEKSYRLFVQELPTTTPGKSVVKVAMRVGIPVFVVPKDPLPTLSMERARVESGIFLVTIANSGNSHAMIERIVVSGLDAGGKPTFKKELNGWYVLPGSSRSFPIDLPPDDVGKSRLLEITGTTKTGTVEGKFDVDEHWSAMLAEGAEKRKQAEKEKSNEGPPPPGKP
jgi:fimbrial chaperone protein